MRKEGREREERVGRKEENRAERVGRKVGGRRLREEGKRKKVKGGRWTEKG